ncbi:hypothetical protein [Maricaulis alexandrii]|uniref:hypothetical protein n=1 Tax=Maricaulis alexandrii TaxID=2570354 RepID=UPI001108682C|nr:hypothetical protein [Maricaulis alexandrii]
MASARQLFLDWIDRELSDDRLDADNLKARALSVAMAELVQDRFSETELEALETAKACLTGSVPEPDRMARLVSLFKLRDALVKAGQERSEAFFLNQILLASLVTHGGLDQQMYELLDEVREGLGLSDVVCIKVARRVICG